MSLTLYFHPLSSYCHKALIALYELEVEFEPHVLDLMDPAVRAAYLTIWPIGKMPVLRDEGRGKTIVEASCVIEYLQLQRPGKGRLVPEDPELACEARMWDRFFDLYLNDTVGKIVTDKLRPAGKGDPFGVEEARARIETAYGVLEERLAGRRWIVGEELSLADCAAAPALFYASKLVPFGGRKESAGYLGRLMARPSYARVLREAEPYFALFPG
jgi:glutathione S-transferase